MIPVLHGVWASGGLAGDFEHIETQTVGAGGAASVTFSSIPGTYKHLQVRGLVRSNFTGGTYNVFLYCKVNNNTTSTNYSTHTLIGNGAGAASYATANSGGTYGTDIAAGVGFVPWNASTASTFGAVVLDLLDYASTSKNKTFRALSGVDLNNNDASGRVQLSSAAFLSTSAVTELSFSLGTNGSFVQHSTFSLYGVK